MVGETRPHHSDDPDCECLDCEEMRYWEAKEIEGHDDIEDLMLRSFATSNEEAALDRAT